MPHVLRTHLLPALFDPTELRGGVAVVLDVLRASTTLIHALANGAESVIPTETVDDALRIKQGLPPGTVLLGGERDGLLIPGFDLDNNPFAYSPDVVRGKTIVFTTTNGTRAVERALRADSILIGGFVNLSALVAVLRQDERPLHLVCAGTNGKISQDDALCAGAIVDRLLSAPSPALGDALDDPTQLALYRYRAAIQADGLLAAMRRSAGGRDLIGLGFDEQISRAATVDLFAVVPEYDAAAKRIALRNERIAEPKPPEAVPSTDGAEPAGIRHGTLNPRPAMPESKMEKIVSLAKRRGFIFQSSEIYGGLNGFWDYGPLGVELKRNVRQAWWADMITNHDEHSVPEGAPSSFDMVGVETSIIMHPQVWKCSGHYDMFVDKMVDCKACKGRFRLDHLPTSECPLKPSKRPGEFEKCQLTEPRDFNLMFKTIIGALGGEEDAAFLRPETAQGMFVNFKNVCDSSRVKIPFGIAQIGKSFRNEITPRNFTFRSREFEQMEMEFFCHPAQSLDWYRYWRDRRYQWYVRLGIAPENLILREHSADELSHYSVGTADIEYAFPFLEPGQFGELEGVAHRGDFDLRSHMEGKLCKENGALVVERTAEGKPKYPGSGKDLSYFDDQKRERFLPHVIEPAAGCDRATLAFLCEAYHEDEAPDDKGQMQTRVVLKLHPQLAPIKVAVFPLVKKDGQPEKALEIYREFKRHGIAAAYDQQAAIGRRYRRMDEIGTPFCLTIDNQTLTDDTVTIRDRDTLLQERIPIRGIVEKVRDRLKSGTTP